MWNEHSEAMGPPGDMVYRTPAVLPFELIQHTGIFFEEQLCMFPLVLGQPPTNPSTDTQALNLLFNTLSSGTYASKKVIVPLPQHLALASTFLVHPSTTTQAKSAEQKEAAHAALRLLRLLSTLITPRDARLDLAFSFKRTQTSRSGRLLHADDGYSSSDLPHDKTDWQRLDVANESSLWSRAEDFWHAVGWAFNCSVLYPERWERWQTWLQFMCDILLDDWNDRVREYEETQEKKQQDTQEGTTEEPGGKGSRSKKKDDLDIFRGSMLYRYICTGTHGQSRRIIRAIFADGSNTSVNEFRQVFPKELKRVKSKQAPEKAKKRDREVNIEREEYGDYLSQDDSDEEGNASGSSSSPTGSKRRTKRTRRGTRNADPTTEPLGECADATQSALTQHSGGVSTMGGLDSLGLRKRLLGLLSTVSQRLPNDFMHSSDLYYLFVENIRPLPLSIFQAFVSPYILTELPDDQQTHLCETLLLFMRESTALSEDEEDLSQSKLETYLLPFAATTTSVVDNAKVSVLLEALFVLLANRDMLTPTPSLKEAVESGILRRAERAQDDRRSVASRSMESLEWCWLVESGERLMFLVELLASRPSQQVSQAES